MKEGSQDQVEFALGLRATIQAPKAKAAVDYKTYNVRINFQFPAWDEVDGLLYEGVEATSKSHANSIVRKKAENDGHLIGAKKGRVNIKADEV